MTDGITQPPHLIWELRNGKYVASIWFLMDFGVNNWKRKHVLSMHELSEAMSKLPIDELVKLYPAPAME